MVTSCVAAQPQSYHSNQTNLIRKLSGSIWTLCRLSIAALMCGLHLGICVLYELILRLRSSKSVLLTSQMARGQINLMIAKKPTYLHSSIRFEQLFDGRLFAHCTGRVYQARAFSIWTCTECLLLKSFWNMIIYDCLWFNFYYLG